MKQILDALNGFATLMKSGVQTKPINVRRVKLKDILFGNKLITDDSIANSTHRVTTIKRT